MKEILTFYPAYIHGVIKTLRREQMFPTENLAEEHYSLVPVLTFLVGDALISPLVCHLAGFQESQTWAEQRELLKR